MEGNYTIERLLAPYSHVPRDIVVIGTSWSNERRSRVFGESIAMIEDNQGALRHQLFTFDTAGYFPDLEGTPERFLLSVALADAKAAVAGETLLAGYKSAKDYMVGLVPNYTTETLSYFARKIVTGRFRDGIKWLVENSQCMKLVDDLDKLSNIMPIVSKDKRL